MFAVHRVRRGGPMQFFAFGVAKDDFRHLPSLVSPSAPESTASAEISQSAKWKSAAGNFLLLRTFSSFSGGDGNGDPKDPLPHRDDRRRRQQLYLHIAPCGDHWTSPELFAAKHLQPDYVRSIPVPDNFDAEDAFFGEEDDGGEEVIRRAYDEGSIPDDILRRFEDEEGGVSTENKDVKE
mmetsp:Transcript_39478/g.118506  ORF Transcript_39478/g.118506 Transcript_39478/m.118506 type:complete len:180 (-) Transcript_39478:1764-2303(-)